MTRPYTMHGLDLLLAVGDTVEAVHQAAWFALLKHSDFLVFLAFDIITERRGKVVFADELSEILRQVSSSVSATSAVQDLARAYAGQLDDLVRRGHNHRTTDNRWCAHDQHFYEELRKACPEMRQAVVCYVPNQSGGFEACHWAWAEAADGVKCYVQWEGSKLCFKILVDDPSVRAPARLKAVEFLRDRALPPTKIVRPIRLGSGRTMTVGIVEDLPIRDEARFAELVQAMTVATSVVEQMAQHLHSG